uniref:DUF2786 domain-containing protein n=1 Tax=Janibacter limosus TaxID=53458 RepID=A0AC61U3F7_9MICO|nr:DUF2786 domain-containing protein [Janibacter limosus]
MQAAVELISTIWAVPSIESLGPRPGEARPSTRRSSSRVDPRVLERVRALLAKAESTTFEAEAETFTAGAQSLMARHSIDAALLAATERTTAGPTLRRVGVDNPYESPKVSLLSGIASANYCRAVWSKDHGARHAHRSRRGPRRRRDALHLAARAGDHGDGPARQADRCLRTLPDGSLPSVLPHGLRPAHPREAAPGRGRGGGRRGRAARRVRGHRAGAPARGAARRRRRRGGRVLPPSARLTADDGQR